jgi:hypothetical protein
MLYELDRGWRQYMGMYVPPRESYLEWPDLDDVFGKYGNPHTPEGQNRDREL